MPDMAHHLFGSRQPRCAEQLQADLDAIDARRFEVLDFVALPSRPMSKVELS